MVAESFLASQTLVDFLTMVPKYISVQAIRTTRPRYHFLSLSSSPPANLSSTDLFCFVPPSRRHLEAGITASQSHKRPAHVQSTLLAPWSDAQTRDSSAYKVLYVGLLSTLYTSRGKSVAGLVLPSTPPVVSRGCERNSGRQPFGVADPCGLPAWATEKFDQPPLPKRDVHTVKLRNPFSFTWPLALSISFSVTGTNARLAAWTAIESTLGA